MDRREFLVGVGAGVAAAAMGARARARDSIIRVGLVGCGGRGTGAAMNVAHAGDDVRIVALGDVFRDRLEGCRGALMDPRAGVNERVDVSDDRCFVGFDAYERVLDHVDVVLLATPPHFRPKHLAAAVAKGKHAFVEKPVGVDGPGVRAVLEAASRAQERKLSIVAGTQRRHEASYLAAVARLREGAIGRVVSASCYWNQGGLWMHKRRPEWTDMEWQLRNWLYFTWLSGDHIVEQHVHNLDVCNWVLGGHPVRARGMGGRQVRVSPEYGNVFDHFAVEYEYEGGAVVHSFCRQIDGCEGRVEEVFRGEKGLAVLRPGSAEFTGGAAWRYEGPNNSPYGDEQRALIESVRSGAGRNEGRAVAEATLTAILGRMAAYTGKVVTWEQALHSEMDLSPAAYELGAAPMPAVAVPGRDAVE